MKAWTLVLLTAAATLLVGCQGQDPGKDYSQVKASANQPYDSVRGSQVVKPPPPPEGGTERPACPAPQITVKEDSGDRVLMFTEGVEKTFEISIRSFAGGDLNVTPMGLGSDFHNKTAEFKVDQKSGNLSTYKLTWKPGKLKAAGQPEIQALNFSYNNQSPKICGPKGQFAVNLLVVPAAKGDTK